MMDPLKIGNGLPVIGPGTGVGISSLPVVGCLGKNYDPAKAPPDGYCPACKEKGKLKALKAYRISFQESVFLCEDLQCIYPLGSKSLNNSISPESEDCHTANKPQKRKLLETSYKYVPLLANSKKTRTHIATDGEEILDSKYGEVYGETSPAFPDHSSHQEPLRAAGFLEQNETLDAGDVDMTAEEDGAAVAVLGPGRTLPLRECSEVQMPPGSKPLCQTVCVQWKNTQALCWLDCILSVLVHLEGLKNTVTALCSKEKCVFWRLLGNYDQANKLLYTDHLASTTGGHHKRTTSEIFEEIETCLNEVRDEIFTKLQPQLRCTLGEMESPVFAFPLMLRIEPHIEELFTYSFSWVFKCSQCGCQYQNRCTKSLVTFTNVIPEWHPLNAAHFGPCNSCNNKSQIRKMVLEIVSPVFMLHFVEGLPQNDLQRYAFHWQGSLYQVTSVIQYQASSHFITWILDADGSWLECDDLKGPCAKRHKKFNVPASEIHIVIWERRLFQVADKETASLVLTKPNDHHADGEERTASPALCSLGEATSVTHPTHLPPAPQTPTQARAKQHGLLDSILPLTPEGTSQEVVSLFQIDSKDSLVEDKPTAETPGLLRAGTVQPQEAVMVSLLSNLCKEQPARVLFSDSGFPSEGVSTDLQSVVLQADDPVVLKSLSNAPVTDMTSPVQEVKAAETKKDTPLQFLPLKAEKLRPEQHTSFQASNLKPKETTACPKTVLARSTQNQPVKESQKKPFMGSWVQGLLRKGAAFMPPCVSAHNRSTIIDLQPSVKGANNFDGFKTKGACRKSSRASRKACRCVDEPLAVSSSPPGSPPAGSTAAAPHAELGKKKASTPHVAQLSHTSPRNENHVSPADHGDLVEDQIHKLRLKLLKKLKAKKKKLAALTSSSQTVTPPNENLEPVSHCESPNDGESIEDLLNELQHHIDIAGESKCPAITVTSYNSQNHEEILAELLSPTTISTERSESVEPDLRYLEMGDSSSPAPEPSELNTHLEQDHNYCSPFKKTQCGVEPDSAANSACIRALNLQSPVKTDIFDEFFSASSLTSLANDTLDLPHFDEYLFENY